MKECMYANVRLTDSSMFFYNNPKVEVDYVVHYILYDFSEVEDMYKVGEFCRMTGLSKETLRYYAQIKLLEPVYIDPRNNYRYYDNGSYLVARLLVYLRKFDFSIQEMLTVVNDESFEHLEDLIKEKRRNLLQEVHRLQTTIKEMDEFFEMEKGDEEK